MRRGPQHAGLLASPARDAAHEAVPTFHLRLRPVRGVDGTKALRAALKNLLRQFGLRALSVEVEPPPYAPPDREPTKTIAEQQRAIRDLSTKLRELRRGGAR